MWTYPIIHQCYEENHRFEARYDIEPGVGEVNSTISPTELRKLIEATHKKTYVQDVCVYCGKVIGRE